MPKVYMGGSLLGDALFAEPALRAYALAKGEPVRLILNGPPRKLFANHPDIILEPDNTEKPTEPGWITITCNYAFSSSAGRTKHIAEGYFFRLGLNPAKFDTKPRLHIDGLRTEEVEDTKSKYTGRKFIALAPFSASCSVHKTGIANKTIPIEWWEELTHRFKKLYPDMDVVSFGNDYEPEVWGSDNWRGQDLTDVFFKLNQAELLVGGDTGITAIAGAMNQNILLLSCAIPVWLTGPQTESKLEVLTSTAPPSWTVDDALQAIERILSGN